MFSIIEKLSTLMMTYTNEYMQYTISTDHFHVAKLHIFFNIANRKVQFFFVKGKIIYHFLKKRKISKSIPSFVPTKNFPLSTRKSRTHPERNPKKTETSTIRKTIPSAHSQNTQYHKHGIIIVYSYYCGDRKIAVSLQNETN